MPVIKPKVRGFICITTHPKGCEANIKEQVEYVKSKGEIEGGPKKVLVIGSSTGYGLSSLVSAAFGSGADTFGVFFERPPAKGKPGSAGWYNSVAFQNAAHEAGLYARGINGDAFSHEIKEKTIAALKEEMGPVDLIVYSLASPRRVDPDTGEVYKSCLKPIGGTFNGKSLDTDKKEIIDVEIEPATDEDIEHTRKVMGGEDWELWIKALDEAGLIAPGATSMAYTYIGPEVTWPIYTNGTIGQAKQHLEESGKRIHEKLAANGGGRAFVSVNKALVTQASSAIPVVPLYNSILFKIMKELGTHEGCIEQMYRLMAERLYNGSDLQLDEAGRVRVDDWEMREEVQAKVKEIWPQVTTENLMELTDFAGYQEDFLKLFGFNVEGVDYEEDVSVEAEFKTPVDA